MTQRQRNVVVISLLIAAAMVLFPPVELKSGTKAGYAFLFSMRPIFQVSVSSLLSQLGLVALVGVAAFFFYAGKGEESPADVLMLKDVQARPSPHPSGNLIGKFWRGEKPLWQAYWLVGIGGQALFFLVLPSSPGPGTNIWFCLSTAYIIWSFVSIWRCAENASHPFWKYVARGMILLGAFALLKALAGA